MQDDGLVIPPDEVPEFFAKDSALLQRHTGCLAAHAQDGRVVAKGTVTFARIDDEFFGITAAHVAVGIGAQRTGSTLILPPTKVGVPQLPVQLSYAPTVLWPSKPTELDVAFVKLPKEVEARVLSFDLDAAAGAAGQIREEWAGTEEGGSLPFAIGGYPDWSHLRDQESKREIISASPLFAYVTQWDVAQIVGAKPPQICAELVTSPPDPEELAGLNDIEQKMAQQMTILKNPFGGYSGGPLALFASDGIFLIGTVKEGGELWGSARAFCSPIDVVLRQARPS